MGRNLFTQLKQLSMELSTCRITGKVIRQAETAEDRVLLLKFLSHKRQNAIHTQALKPQGTSPSVRRQMRGATASGYNLHPNPNNRAMTPDRAKTTQKVLLTFKVIDRVFPDGGSHFHREPFFPYQYKTITHARPGWLR